MDEVCENGDAALPALEQYLQTQTDAPEIDTEASLKSSRPTIRNFSSSRTADGGATAFCCRGGCFRRRNRVCAGCRSQSVRLCSDVGFRDVRLFQSGHDDFETTEDGYTHFPDGTSVNYEHATDTVEYDPNAPLGSEANPLPADPQVPEPGYEDLPDTDLSDTNLEKPSPLGMKCTLWSISISPMRI